MGSALDAFLRRTHARLREAWKAFGRSSGWAHCRDVFLKAHPTCAACGATKTLQVHHKLPFGLRPDLELDMQNLITLCMTATECHLRIGHGGSFEYYNPNVEADAATILATPTERANVEKLAEGRRLRI